MSAQSWEDRIIAKIDKIESMSLQVIEGRNQLKATNAALLEALELILGATGTNIPTMYEERAEAAIAKAKAEQS